MHSVVRIDALLQSDGRLKRKRVERPKKGEQIDKFKVANLKGQVPAGERGSAKKQHPPKADFVPETTALEEEIRKWFLEFCFTAAEGLEDEFDLMHGFDDTLEEKQLLRWKFAREALRIQKLRELQHLFELLLSASVPENANLSNLHSNFEECDYLHMELYFDFDYYDQTSS